MSSKAAWDAGETGAARNPTRPSRRSVTCTSERKDAQAGRLGPFAMGGRGDTECDGLADAMGPEWFGDRREQVADLIAKSLRRCLEVLRHGLEQPRVGVLLQHGDEAEVMAPLLLALLEDREDVALDG